MADTREDKSRAINISSEQKEEDQQRNTEYNVHLDGNLSNECNISDARRDSKLSATSTCPKAMDLDDVLVNELGQFGRFQLFNMLMSCVPLILTASMAEFIFLAAAIPHRCQIPECGEDTKDQLFKPSWLPGAIPSTTNGFESCRRYVPTARTNGTLDTTCPASLFTNATMDCDGLVYGRTNSVVYDFDLGCQEWLRALAGTLNYTGTLLTLPFIGFMSDRYGRRVALLISAFSMTLFGLIRAFSVNYPMYLAMQILQTTFAHGIFSAAYIFAAELVGPKYRILIGSFSLSMYSIGQILLAITAWFVQPWRRFIMIIHIPCFLVIPCYWFLNESVRWLLCNEKFNEARSILNKVAKVNKKQINEKSMEALMNPPALTQDVSARIGFNIHFPVVPPKRDDMKGNIICEFETVVCCSYYLVLSNFFYSANGDGPGLISAIVKSPVLLRRMCTTPIWWVSSTFVYHGLTINAASFSDTMYLNFILVSAVEVPGYCASLLMLNKIGRKVSLSIGFFFSAICNIAFVLIPSDMSVLRLVVYLVAKFGICVVVTSLYLYTSELYPTQFRHSLLAFSSMIGRIGSIVAPLTPALMVYWEGIPSVMFGGMALLSGVLVLTQPETLGTKMPDTLAEAEALGRQTKSDRNST